MPPVPGAALARLDGCAGGQDGRTEHGAALPIAAGVGAWSLRFGAGRCDAFAAGGDRDDQRATSSGRTRPVT